MTIKALLLTALLGLGAVPAAQAATRCTLIIEAATGAVRLQEGEGCSTPAAPASTFKVTLALIGFDAGILTAADSPAWPYRKAYQASRPEERRTVTPESWLRDSVLWYSREVVRQLGGDRFAAYVAAFGYGNADVSGDPGRDNGMTHSWLNTSLKISPEQQAGFLRQMLDGTLPISQAARDAVVAIMPRFTAGRWSIHGKTGTYNERNADGSNSSRQGGWFIGWAESDRERLVFAHLIRDTKKTAGAAGRRARDALLARFAAW